MTQDASPNRSLQRRLVLRDSLVFLTLTLITIALFFGTLALFHSFTAHRQVLAERWYARGQRDLAASHATDAIFDLRAAISYSPGDTDYQFLLAEALANAGNKEEAYTYFSELREADPGSGPLNLQLARLSAQKKNATDALHYYRAAIYGTWDSEPIANRRAARLELIHQLLTTGDTATAHTELLIASEDAADDLALQDEIATMMLESGDPATALTLFRKSLAHSPQNTPSLEGAGKAAFDLAHYASAEQYLRKAREHLSESTRSSAPTSTQLLADATRIIALFPAQDLPTAERTARIQRLAAIAQAELSDCRLQPVSEQHATTLDALDEAWKANAKLSSSRRRSTPFDPSAQLQLVYSTIEQTGKFCKVASPDARLLQLIAASPETILQ